LLEDFNLLISTSRRNERKACSELWYLLCDIGDRTARIDITNISGLVVANTSLNPIEVVDQLRNMIREKPWEFKYILKIVPIKGIISTSIENIKQTALNMAEEINNKQKYRISIRKRNTNISSTDLIEKIAPAINKKVNLKSPDLILLIEIIGDVTGMSLIKPKSILSVERSKRTL
jgi:tRNA acetyltransferase TAN1